MKIGTTEIGAGRCYVIAECGLNHNGDGVIATDMIDCAMEAGADAVKFQKRTLSLNYTEEEMAAPRPGPWGETNGDLKRLLEFSLEDHKSLRDYAHHAGLEYIVSPWDEPALQECIILGVDAIKIPSARLHRRDICVPAATSGLPVILSTGMSTESEILEALGLLATGRGDVAVLACVSAYPCGVDDLHLRRINTLQGIVDPDETPVGYSSHAVSPWPALCAVAMGAEIIECHVTLDRSMWGSDQAASLEFVAFAKLVEEIRTFERARGSGELKVLPCEEAVREKLRR